MIDPHYIPVLHRRCLVAQSSPILCDPMDCSPPGSSVYGDSPGKNTGVDGHALLQGIFPAQGLNPGLPHCRRILYHLSHQESPRILEWGGKKNVHNWLLWASASWYWYHRIHLQVMKIHSTSIWQEEKAGVLFEVFLKSKIAFLPISCLLGFPGGSEVKASAFNAGDLGSIPGSGRSPGEGNGNPLQYSCLENLMDRGAW